MILEGGYLMSKLKSLFFLSAFFMYTQGVYASQVSQLAQEQQVLTLLDRILTSNLPSFQITQMIEDLKNKVASDTVLSYKVNQFLIQKGFSTQASSSMDTLSDILVLLNSIVNSTFSMEEKEQLFNNLWKKLTSRPDLQDQMNIFLQSHGYPVIRTVLPEPSMPDLTDNREAEVDMPEPMDHTEEISMMDNEPTSVQEDDNDNQNTPVMNDQMSTMENTHTSDEMVSMEQPEHEMDHNKQEPMDDGKESSLDEQSMNLTLEADQDNKDMQESHTVEKEMPIEPVVEETPMVNEQPQQEESMSMPEEQQESSVDTDKVEGISQDFRKSLWGR